MQHPAATAFTGTLALGSFLEAGRQARIAERAAMAEDVSQARAASAVRRLGLELAASHQREEALQDQVEDLRAELEAMRLKAMKADGLLMRLARQM
jgi:hypothetical protein